MKRIGNVIKIGLLLPFVKLKIIAKIWTTIATKSRMRMHFLNLIIFSFVGTS